MYQKSLEKDNFLRKKRIQNREFFTTKEILPKVANEEIKVFISTEPIFRLQLYDDCQGVGAEIQDGLVLQKYKQKEYKRLNVWESKTDVRFKLWLGGEGIRE